MTFVIQAGNATLRVNSEGNYGAGTIDCNQDLPDEVSSLILSLACAGVLNAENTDAAGKAIEVALEAIDNNADDEDVLVSDDAKEAHWNDLTTVALSGKCFCMETDLAICRDFQLSAPTDLGNPDFSYIAGCLAMKAKYKVQAWKNRAWFLDLMGQIFDFHCVESGNEVLSNYTPPAK